VAIEAHLAQQQGILVQFEADHQVKNRLERPYSALAKARQKLVRWQARLDRCEKKVVQQERQWQAHQQQEVIAPIRTIRLQQRLQAFEADNQSNSFPMQAVFRIDAGFGTREKVRSASAIFLQEQLAVFAANFFRWAVQLTLPFAQNAVF
jgi:hypothetical protein